MSYITRRALSTLIPPKIASPTAIGAAQDAARMERVVNFYARLPRGSAPAPKPTGLLERYQARYFNGKKASPMHDLMISRRTKTALVHVIGTLLLVNYSIQYYYHLRHHKNHPH
ncbi:hypothetical protein PISL3812_07639 [Talaromyces islandicus]|uniref:F-type H+-transporting ATPase subunit F n=1 Tax=Talaromyces islandicus TaxID=28573 RepID=A0A0U1M4X4_TALIS|nr:hypothetical protein PISL3812_07639 [Talaromyces islandicus]